MYFENNIQLNVEVSKNLKDLLQRPKSSKVKKPKKKFLEGKVDANLVDSDDENETKEQSLEDKIAEIADRFVVFVLI